MSPSVKHLNFIQTLTNLIVVALENKRLGKQALQQERDKRELELAAELQGMLVPRDLPNNNRIEAAAWYLPHRQVGGDYYDLITLGQDEHVIAMAAVGLACAPALALAHDDVTFRTEAEHEAEDSVVHTPAVEAQLTKRTQLATASDVRAAAAAVVGNEHDVGS